MAEVKAITKLRNFQGVTVRDHSIDFGTVVRFQDGEHKFERAGSDEQLVRNFVSEVLKVARSTQCDGWLKRVVVEGLASKTGDYLFNLNLSYFRAQRVLCALLATKVPGELEVSDRRMIQTLFLTGGSSFNTTSDTPAQMRRVELRLEFWEKETRETPPEIPLDPGLRCPNDR